MSPSPGAAPLPPLPDLGGSASTSSASAPGGDAMASLVSGIAPVKRGVDMILAGTKLVMQSGAVAGAENPCGQIVALATSLLPMAARQALQPGPAGASTPSAPTAPGPGGAPQ